MVEENFSWLPFFEELLDIICNKYNPHTLYSEFKKLVPEEQYNDINQMDPLTFIGCICAGNRIAINRAALVKKNFNMKSNPISDINGIPNFVHGTYKYFHEIYKGADISDVMQILWDFARQINENNINEETFNTIVNFNEVKVGKLSQIMYICKPRSFYTCDSKMLSYLYNNIENNYKSFLEIQVYCKTLNTAPYILSAKAWQYSCRRKDFFDYIKKINKPSYDDFISRQILSEKFEKEIFNFSGKRLFDVKNIKDIETLLEKLKNNEDWNKYDKSHGNGIPNAILNTHYKNFINGTEEKILLSAKKYWIYQPGEQGRLWDDVYTNNIIAIGWEELGDLKQYNSEENLAEKIKEIYSKKSNPDKLANWEFANVMNIGDIVYVKKGLKDLIGRGIVQSDYYFDDTRKEYKSVRKIQWTHNGTYSVDFSKLGIKQWVQKTLTDISEDKYKDFCLKIEDIFMNNNQNEQDNIIPLNQILYGPPGTGKTYKLENIIKDYIYPQIADDHESTNIYDDILLNCNLNWVEKIIFAFKINNSQNKPLTDVQISKLPLIQRWFSISSNYKDEKSLICSIRGEMQKNAIRKEGVYARHENNYFERQENGFILIDDGEKLYNELCEHYDININSFDNNIQTDKSILAKDYYVFCTFHQSYSYEEFVEGIRPIINKSKQDETSKDKNLSTMQFDFHCGIFKDMCIKAKKEPNKKFFIFIDEINRGNISKIFGELITLIEKDKREKVVEDGREYHTIEVTLPYTNDRFTVPNNLYIVGTMNTADKSLALLDVALRRRFEFVPMYPKYDLKDLKHKEFLEALNDRIYFEKKSEDFLIGHTYFLGSEAEDLSEVMNKKVTPLLMEYFNAKKEMVEDIVGPLLEKEGYCIDKNEKYLLKVVRK